jgi:hypothetical protein
MQTDWNPIQQCETVIGVSNNHPDWAWLTRLHDVSRTAHRLKLYRFLMNFEFTEFS